MLLGFSLIISTGVALGGLVHPVTIDIFITKFALYFTVGNESLFTLLYKRAQLIPVSTII